MPASESPPVTIDRRTAVRGVVVGAALTGFAPHAVAHGGAEPMTVACLIRYQIDPFQREAFRAYAQAWTAVIPRCGGRLIGYFLPWEGTNDVAWALIAFESLAAYEAYRQRLRADPDGRANLEQARRLRFILREERSWVEAVGGMAGLPAAG